MNINLLRYVLEELEYYQFEWKHDISDSAIRRGSASLRILLHENKLQNAWKEAGFDKQPKIFSKSLDDFNVNDSLNDFSFMQAGGAKTFGMENKKFTMYDRALSEEEVKLLYDSQKMEVIQKPEVLSEFKMATCIIIEKNKISRDDLIQYVGNKLGGSHFDEKRDKNKELERKYELMDGIRKEFKVGDRDPIMLELLTIVHFIQQSKDVHKLRKKIMELLIRKKS